MTDQTKEKLMERKMYEWAVDVQSERGDVHTETVRAFWSPEHETTKAGVADCAKVQAWLRTDKKVQFAPISEPELQEAA